MQCSSEATPTGFPTPGQSPEPATAQLRKRYQWRVAKQRSRARLRERKDSVHPMTPPMTKYDLRSAGRVDQEIRRDPRTHSTAPHRGGRRNQPVRRVTPYPTHGGGSTQAYSGSTLDSSPDVQEPCTIDPRSDTLSYPRVEILTEPRQSIIHTPLPVVNSYPVLRNEATPPESTLSSDQAPLSPENVPDWLKTSSDEFWRSLNDFDAPTWLEGGDPFSSDSGVPTSAPSAITNSSSPLTDVMTYPKDSGETNASPGRTAIQIVAMVQTLTIQEKQSRLELEHYSNELRIKELEAELDRS